MNLNNEPRLPLKGRNFSRVEISMEDYAALYPIYPLHVTVVGVRRAINSYGRLGLIPAYACSPECAEHTGVKFSIWK